MLKSVRASCVFRVCVHCKSDYVHTCMGLLLGGKKTQCVSLHCVYPLGQLAQGKHGLKE